MDEKNNYGNNNINPNLKKNSKNNKNFINIQEKKNVNYSKRKKGNRIMKKRKKFSPLPKDKYRDNNSFQKLLMNRLEKQILTDIYDDYQNKEEFEETYSHIENIKNILNRKNVEKAINYLNSIEPMSLREKIIIESTYFFKEIIKEEIDFAENNDRRLILYKQPDYLLNKKSKHKSALRPLSRSVNKNFRNHKKSKNSKYGKKPKYNNNINKEYENESYNNNSFFNNNFNKKPFRYISKNNKKYHK
jgi:hypothetical protein